MLLRASTVTVLSSTTLVCTLVSSFLAVQQAKVDVVVSSYKLLLVPVTTVGVDNDNAVVSSSRWSHRVRG